MKILVQHVAPDFRPGDTARLRLPPDREAIPALSIPKEPNDE